MTQDEITAILENVPKWATEETLDALNIESSGNNVMLAQISAILGEADKATVATLGRKADKVSDTASTTQEKIIATSRKAQKQLSKMISQTDPVNAVAELSHETAKLLANAGIGLAKFTSGIKGVGTAVNAVSKVAGTSLVVGTGLGVIFAKLLSEQEKQTRQFVEFGSIVADQGLWTSLRSSTRSLGMGLKEYTEMADQAKPFLTRATGDVFTGQLALSEFIDSIDQDKTFMDFGLAVQDQSRFITQETETLYQLGQITEVNNMTKQKVMDGFASANELALFTGNTLGVQRTEALRLREEARSNVDIQIGLIQNADFIAEQYGETAAKDISDAVGFMAMLNANTFGPDWSEQFQKHVQGMVHDISFDQVAVNNIDANFLAKMRMIGPGVAETYIKLVEDTSTGKINSKSEAATRQRELVKMVREAGIRVSAFNPLLGDVNVLIAKVKLIPDAYMKADLSILSEDGIFGILAEQADDTIDVIDDMSVTFQQIQEIITPSYKTTSKGFTALTGTMMNFGRGLSKLFGGDSEERFNEMYQLKVEEANIARLSQVNSDNIVSNIEMIAMRIDEVKSGQAELKDWTEGGINEEGDAFTKDEEFALEAQRDQLADQMLELLAYQEMLMTKKAELEMPKGGE